MSQSAEVNMNVLVDAHEQYTRKLTHAMQKCVTVTILQLYKDAEADGGVDIRQLMGEVKEWPEEIVEEETEALQKACPWMMRAVKAIYVSNAMIMSSVDTGGGQPKIQIDVPSPQAFVHRVYMLVAESMLSVKALDMSNISALKRVIGDSVRDALEDLFPTDKLLADPLAVIDKAKRFTANEGSGDDDGEKESGDDIEDEDAGKHGREDDSGAETLAEEEAENTKVAEAHKDDDRENRGRRGTNTADGGGGKDGGRDKDKDTLAIKRMRSTTGRRGARGEGDGAKGRGDDSDNGSGAGAGSVSGGDQSDRSDSMSMSSFYSSEDDDSVRTIRLKRKSRAYYA